MATRTTTKYESDSGTIHKITASDETISAAGAAPDGAVNSNIIAKITKSNREYGIRPRKVRLSRIIGTAPNDFRAYKDLPVLTTAVFTSAAYSVGSDLTVGAADWTIIAKVGEDF